MIIDRRSHSVSPRGFTLLELMLSMVLMSALLAATWTLLGIFRDRFDRSQQQTEQWQLIRSLQKTVERDLRSCQMRPIEVEETTSAQLQKGVATAGGVDTNSAEPLENPADQFSDLGVENANSFGSSSMGFGADTNAFPDQNGRLNSYDGFNDFNPLGSLIETDWLATEILFVGTQQGLIFDVTPPASSGDRRPWGADINRAELPDVHQRVIYLFSDPRTAYVKDRPAGLVRCLLTNRQLTLVRHFGTGNQDLLTILMPALQELVPPSMVDHPLLRSSNLVPADSDAELNSPRDLRVQFSDLHRRIEVHRSLDYAPEVATWSFRYFGGGQWRNSWDSREEKTIPVAVELRFQLAHEIKPIGISDAEVDATEFHDATNEALEMEALDLVDPLEPVDDEIMSAQTQPVEDHRYLVYLRPAKTRHFDEDGEWMDDFGGIPTDDERGIEP